MELSQNSSLVRRDFISSRFRRWYVVGWSMAITICSGCLFRYELLHTTYWATHVTLLYDNLSILIAEGAEMWRFEIYLFILVMTNFKNFHFIIEVRWKHAIYAKMYSLLLLYFFYFLLFFDLFFFFHLFCVFFSFSLYFSECCFCFTNFMAFYYFYYCIILFFIFNGSSYTL